MRTWTYRLILGAAAGWLIGVACALDLVPLLAFIVICAGLTGAVFYVTDLIRNDLPPW